MDWLKEAVTKAWTWFIIAGAVILMEIILKEHIQNVINSSSPEAIPYLRLIQIGVFAVPAIAGIYLAIKNHEESK
jgi:hypothetical protein